MDMLLTLQKSSMYLKRIRRSYQVLAETLQLLRPRKCMLMFVCLKNIYSGFGYKKKNVFPFSR